MAQDEVAAKKLGRILSSLSHPVRLMIIAELYSGERCVSELKELMVVSSSSVSNHLSVLRAIGLVRERRDGHHVFYSLSNPQIALWLIEAVSFLGPDSTESEELEVAIKLTQSRWRFEDKVVSHSM